MSLPGPVLHVITRMEAGGAPRSVLQLLEGLREAGVEVELAVGVTAPGLIDISGEATALGITLHRIPAMRRAPHPLRDLRALLHLIRLIRDRRPALVHGHTSKAGFLSRLAARRAGVPSVFSPRGTILEGYFTPLSRAFYVALERRAARWTEAIIGLTPEESESYLEAGIGTPDQHLSIPIGIDLRRFELPDERNRAAARAERGVSEDEVLIISSGRLVPVKDQRTLVEALGLLEAGAGTGSWRCWVLGEGPDRETLAGRCRELGIEERVSFLGYVDDVPLLLSLGDVFALTSINEGFGRVLLEAMAARLAIVATRVGGIPSVLDDGRAGMLIPPRDPEALAEALATLIADRDQRSRLAGAGAERVRTVYTPGRVVEQHIELYAAVLAGN